MTPEVATEPDRFAIARAHAAPGPLRAFNDIGVLAAADVHVARTLARLAGERDEGVALAAALAVRGPRLGHVFVDLATIRDTATVDADEPVDLSGLPWPEPDAWIGAVGASALVAVGEDADGTRPLRLLGTRLYLDRYWREERQVAADLRAFYAGPDGPLEVAPLRDGLTRLFKDETGGRQALAAAAAVLRRFAVIAGGPGTGKTTTVARVVALLAEQSARDGDPPPLVALAAPTGKAAARLEESVHAEARDLRVEPAIRDLLTGLSASTLHRLLGRRAGSHSRFRHHRGNRLPHDVVIVDETSMVSLSLMARLVEAVRSDARLILVGDPGQLTSIEAGAVLGDVVGPAGAGRMRMRPAARRLLAEATGAEVAADDPPPGAEIGDGIVVLDRVHRYGGAIAGLAEAIRAGDGGALVDRLRATADDAITWIDVDAGDPDVAPALDPVRAAAVGSARAVIDAARAGDAPAAIAALGAFRLLCAHRQGPHGAATWTARVEAWLADAVRGFASEGEWYPGRPLLVTENDHGLKLYNGDTGVVVAGNGGQVSAAFERAGQVLEISPTRLAAVDAVYAMTVHKSQGSQFDTAALLLPTATSRILTRELLYTAVTRARERLIIVGTEDTLRAAVARPIARASGLRERVWAPGA